MEEVVKVKKRSNKVAKGSETYEQFTALMKILNENRANKKLSLKEKVYLFNELDLLLSEGVDINLLIKCAKYRHDAIPTMSLRKNFDIGLASAIENAHEFLQDLEANLKDATVSTKYEFYIDDKIVIPTEKQEKFVIDYLKKNNLPVNERTYCLALRRLIVGGDIESKFEKTYFINKTKELQTKTESPITV